MKHLIFKILVISLAVFIPACGVWENFTTYFNLYYNTSDIFEQAEEAILQQERSIFDPKEVTVPGSANQNLNKVIEKCSKLLQFHGNSSFVDEALMMLGKSFYYQKNYLKALRKFEELAATQKESKYYLEAELWIGRTQMRLRDFTTALNTLDSLKTEAAKEGEDQIVTKAFIEQITYYVSREDYPQAVKLSEELIPIADDEEQKAEILYETGNFYLQMKQPENAIKYFQMVSDYSPRYTVQFNTLISLGRTLRDLGRKEDALEVFEGMRLENKYRDDFDVVDYEIGMTYLTLGRISEAQENLVYVDTSYATSTYSGLARFTLGNLYENQLMNFDSAAVYYQKAAASQVPATRVKEIQNRNQVFIKYKDITGKIEDARKQIYYLDNPEAFILDSTSYYDSVKAAAIQDSLMGGDEQRGRFGQTRSPQNLTFRVPPVRPVLTRDSLMSSIRRNNFNLANLFFGEMNKPDSAAKYYTGILLDTAASEYYSKTLYALGDYYLTSGDTVKADSIFNYIYDTYKNEPVVNAAAVQLKKPIVNLNFDLASDLYSYAEKLWMQGSFDSALTAYKQVYTDYPKSNFAPKAWLATGWIYENDLKVPDSAAAVYDSITVKFPGSLYAQNVNPKLIAFKQEQMRIQREAEDSLRLANMKADSLKQGENPVPTDSLSEAERMKLEIEKTEDVKTETVTLPGDSLKTEELKNDTLQPRTNQNNERRNPRRRK